MESWSQFTDQNESTPHVDILKCDFFYHMELKHFEKLVVLLIKKKKKKKPQTNSSSAVNGCNQNESLNSW